MVCGTFLKHLGRPKLLCSQKNSQGHLKVIQGHLKVIFVLLKGMLSKPSKRFLGVSVRKASPRVMINELLHINVFI